MFGCKVVKGYGAILGRAFESAFSKVDLPAFRREREGVWVYVCVCVCVCVEEGMK